MIRFHLFASWLFLKRGLLTTLSYKTALVLGLLSSLIGLLQFSFMGRFLSEGNSFPAIAAYGNNLLGYLIIGTAFTGFQGVSLTSFQSAIRGEQQMGTLQHLLLSSIKMETIMMYSGVWNLLMAFVNVFALFVVVIFGFGISMDVNLASACIILVLTVVALSGIGLASAGIIMVIKQGDPVTWLFTTLTGLFSGVLFPIAYLPNWLRTVSYALPTTHALHGLRLALMKNADIREIGGTIGILSGFAVVLVPLGIGCFRWGYHKARAQGTLAEY